MHGICCIDRSYGPGDVHNRTLRRIELHIPLPFPFLQYMKVILELLIKRSSTLQYHLQRNELGTASSLVSHRTGIGWDPGLTPGGHLIKPAAHPSYSHLGQQSDFSPLGRTQSIQLSCLAHHVSVIYKEV